MVSKAVSSVPWNRGRSGSGSHMEAPARAKETSFRTPLLRLQATETHSNSDFPLTCHIQLQEALLVPLQGRSRTASDLSISTSHLNMTTIIHMAQPVSSFSPIWSQKVARMHVLEPKLAGDILLLMPPRGCLGPLAPLPLLPPSPQLCPLLTWLQLSGLFAVGQTFWKWSRVGFCTCCAFCQQQPSFR